MSHGVVMMRRTNHRRVPAVEGNAGEDQQLATQRESTDAELNRWSRPLPVRERDAPDAARRGRPAIALVRPAVRSEADALRA